MRRGFQRKIEGLKIFVKFFWLKIFVKFFWLINFFKGETNFSGVTKIFHIVASFCKSFCKNCHDGRGTKSC